MFCRVSRDVGSLWEQEAVLRPAYFLLGCGGPPALDLYIIVQVGRLALKGSWASADVGQCVVFIFSPDATDLSRSALVRQPYLYELIAVLLFTRLSCISLQLRS